MGTLLLEGLLGQAKNLSLSLQCRHQEYIVDDVTYMRVKFYVDGSKRKGTVHVDLKKVSWFISSYGLHVCQNIALLGQ